MPWFILFAATGCVTLTGGDGLEFGNLAGQLEFVDLLDTAPDTPGCNTPDVHVVLQLAGDWTVSGNDGTEQFGPIGVGQPTIEHLELVLSNMPEGDCRESGDSCAVCRQQALTVNTGLAYRECCGDQNPEFEEDFDEVAAILRGLIP